MTIWVTADAHWNHLNIIGFCGRPYTGPDGQPDVKAMNQDLIARWNARVKPEDTVYVIGDFALGPARLVDEYLRVLIGHKILIRGNHDRLSKGRYLRAGFEEVHKHLWLGPYLLMHRPADALLLLATEKRHAIILCGHVHDRWAQSNGCINVGVDVRQFQPVMLEELGLASVGE